MSERVSAFFSYGFRPFFLFACLYAVLAMAAWMAWIGRNIHFRKKQNVTTSAAISARTTPNSTKYITVASRATLAWRLGESRSSV